MCIYKKVDLFGVGTFLGGAAAPPLRTPLTACTIENVHKVAHFNLL